MYEMDNPEANPLGFNDQSTFRIPAVVRIAYQIANAMSPVLGAAVARQIFFRPPRASYREEQKAVLAMAQLASLHTRHGLVQAYGWGEGPAVLLMHGWGGHAGQMTELVVPLTKAGHRVIALDAPAHGRSAGHLSSIAHFAAAIAAAAYAFGPFHAVIAHSFGAAATAHQMAKGMTVSRAVFVAPQARFTGYWHLFRQTLGVQERAWEVLRARTERWLKVSYDELHPETVAPRMRTPLLILHGETDRMTPLSEGQALARVWPGAEFRSFDCGHLTILRDWRALVAAAEFVKCIGR